MTRQKRTLKRYIELFRNPRSLFEGSPANGISAPETIIFPNGEREIWIKGQGNKGFRIKASEGPAGLNVTVSRFVGCPPITISGNADDGQMTAIRNLPEAYELSLCQYNADDRSQAFKVWYQGRGEYPVAPLDSDDPLPLNATAKESGK